MKNSPFAQAFEEEIKEWEIWLTYTNSFNEYIVKVQSVWLYLEPIFSSADIVKHLPSEATKFQMVDRQWRNIMDEVRATPNVPKYSYIQLAS
jgi:dynein heavy chain